MGLPTLWLPGPSPLYTGPFRSNVQEFLRGYGAQAWVNGSGLENTTFWIVPLQHGNETVNLHVYEEAFRDTSDGTHICDQCRNMGWQSHPVSTRRYHFVVPSDALLSEPDSVPAMVEAAHAAQQAAQADAGTQSLRGGKMSTSSSRVNLSDLAEDTQAAAAGHASGRGPSARGTAAKGASSGKFASKETHHASTPNADDAEEEEEEEEGSAFNAPESVFESKTHLLHGILHTNGRGHLLRVNGRDGGNMMLPGPVLVGLWDALCGALRAREVSVEDVSNKSGMLLRLLHPAMGKTTWYGKWGYTFGRAAFCITMEQYAHAVQYVHTVKVEDLVHDFLDIDSVMVKILRTYVSMPPALPLPTTTLAALLQRLFGYLSDPDGLRHARASLLSQHRSEYVQAQAQVRTHQQQGLAQTPGLQEGTQQQHHVKDEPKLKHKHESKHEQMPQRSHTHVKQRQASPGNSTGHVSASMQKASSPVPELTNTGRPFRAARLNAPQYGTADEQEEEPVKAAHQPPPPKRVRYSAVPEPVLAMPMAVAPKQALVSEHSAVSREGRPPRRASAIAVSELTAAVAAAEGISSRSRAVCSPQRQRAGTGGGSGSMRTPAATGTRLSLPPRPAHASSMHGTAGTAFGTAHSTAGKAQGGGGTGAGSFASLRSRRQSAPSVYMGSSTVGSLPGSGSAGYSSGPLAHWEGHPCTPMCPGSHAAAGEDADAADRVPMRNRTVAKQAIPDQAPAATATAEAAAEDAAVWMPAPLHALSPTHAGRELDADMMGMGFHAEAAVHDDAAGALAGKQDAMDGVQMHAEEAAVLHVPHIDSPNRPLQSAEQNGDINMQDAVQPAASAGHGPVSSTATAADEALTLHDALDADCVAAMTSSPGQVLAAVSNGDMHPPVPWSPSSSAQRLMEDSTCPFAPGLMVPKRMRSALAQRQGSAATASGTGIDAGASLTMQGGSSLMSPPGQHGMAMASSSLLMPLQMMSSSQGVDKALANASGTACQPPGCGLDDQNAFQPPGLVQKRKDEVMGMQAGTSTGAGEEPFHFPYGLQNFLGQPQDSAAAGTAPGMQSAAEPPGINGPMQMQMHGRDVPAGLTLTPLGLPLDRDVYGQRLLARLAGRGALLSPPPIPHGPLELQAAVPAYTAAATEAPTEALRVQQQEADRAPSDHGGHSGHRGGGGGGRRVLDSTLPGSVAGTSSGTGGLGSCSTRPVSNSGAHIAPAPDDLAKVSLEELRPLHASVESDMAHRDAQRAMDAMLACLRDFCTNQWLARLALRDRMMEYYKDYKMLDWALRELANVTVAGYAVYRSKYTVTRSYYYRLELLPDTLPGIPLQYSVPMPKHGALPKKAIHKLKLKGRAATPPADTLPADVSSTPQLPSPATGPAAPAAGAGAGPVVVGDAGPGVTAAASAEVMDAFGVHVGQPSDTGLLAGHGLHGEPPHAQRHSSLPSYGANPQAHAMVMHGENGAAGIASNVCQATANVFLARAEAHINGQPSPLLPDANGGAAMGPAVWWNSCANKQASYTSAAAATGAAFSPLGNTSSRSHKAGGCYGAGPYTPLPLPPLLLPLDEQRRAHVMGIVRLLLELLPASRSPPKDQLPWDDPIALGSLLSTVMGPPTPRARASAICAANAVGKRMPPGGVATLRAQAGLMRFASEIGLVRVGGSMHGQQKKKGGGVKMLLAKAAAALHGYLRPKLLERYGCGTTSAAAAAGTQQGAGAGDPTVQQQQKQQEEPPASVARQSLPEAAAEPMKVDGELASSCHPYSVGPSGQSAVAPDAELVVLLETALDEAVAAAVSAREEAAPSHVQAAGSGQSHGDVHEAVQQGAVPMDIEAPMPPAAAAAAGDGTAALEQHSISGAAPPGSESNADRSAPAAQQQQQQQLAVATVKPATGAGTGPRRILKLKASPSMPGAASAASSVTAAAAVPAHTMPTKDAWQSAARDSAACQGMAEGADGAVHVSFAVPGGGSPSSPGKIPAVPGNGRIRLGKVSCVRRHLPPSPAFASVLQDGQPCSSMGGPAAGGATHQQLPLVTHEAALAASGAPSTSVLGKRASALRQLPALTSPSQKHGPATHGSLSPRKGHLTSKTLRTGHVLSTIRGIRAGGRGMVIPGRGKGALRRGAVTGGRGRGCASAVQPAPAPECLAASRARRASHGGISLALLERYGDKMDLDEVQEMAAAPAQRTTATASRRSLGGSHASAAGAAAAAGDGAGHDSGLRVSGSSRTGGKEARCTVHMNTQDGGSAAGVAAAWGSSRRVAFEPQARECGRGRGRGRGRRPGGRGAYAQARAEVANGEGFIASSVPGGPFDPQPLMAHNPHCTPGRAHHNSSLSYVRDQVLVDVQYIYLHVLRQYRPAVMVQEAEGGRAASAWKTEAKAAAVRLYELARHTQVLKDCKYFLKDYLGPFAVPAGLALTAAATKPDPAQPEPQKASEAASPAAAAAAAAAAGGGGGVASSKLSSRVSSRRNSESSHGGGSVHARGCSAAAAEGLRADAAANAAAAHESEHNSQPTTADGQIARISSSGAGPAEGGSKDVSMVRVQVVVQVNAGVAKRKPALSSPQRASARRGSLSGAGVKAETKQPTGRERTLQRNLQKAARLQLTPPEVLVLPANATVSELQAAAEEALIDTYMCMRGWRLESLEVAEAALQPPWLLLQPAGAAAGEGVCVEEHDVMCARRTAAACSTGKCTAAKVEAAAGALCTQRPAPPAGSAMAAGLVSQPEQVVVPESHIHSINASLAAAAAPPAGSKSGSKGGKHKDAKQASKADSASHQETHGSVPSCSTGSAAAPGHSSVQCPAQCVGEMGLPDGLVLLATGSGVEIDERWRHAGGPQDWVVWCACGTRDDDGERMISCDACGAWWHTRCAGIRDEEEEPGSFLCAECAAEAGEIVAKANVKTEHL